MVSSSGSGTFDFIVLGGGSGGLAAARRAAEHGARALVIEKSRLGGTCVNQGCVPKKIMWSAAGCAEILAEAPDYGFDVSVSGFSWSRLKRARDAYVKRLNELYAKNLVNEGVERASGVGRFEDAHTLSVGNARFTAPDVLIATGGKPCVPDVPGAEFGITSDDFFELEEQPRRVAIVGAGYVAVELASVFRALGSEVTLLVRKDRLLRAFDEIVGEVLMREMSRRGVVFAAEFEVSRLERTSSGTALLFGTRGQRAEFDCVLWAIGREARTRGFGLERAGVLLDGQGHVAVDEWQNTNVPRVYALGDVTGKMPLTPVAIAAGRKLADRIFGGDQDAKLDYDNVPTVVFSHPPVGSVGLSEEAARERFTDVQCYTRQFTNLHYAVTSAARGDKPRTTVKLVTVGSREQVVGVHVVGMGADELLQGFAVAVRMGATKADFDRTVAIHPTAAEELVTLRP